MPFNPKRKISNSNLEILQSYKHYGIFLEHLGKRYPKRTLAAVATHKIVNEYVKSKSGLDLEYKLSQDWDFGTNLVKLIVSCKTCDFDELTELWNEICFQVYRDVKGVMNITQKELVKLMHHISIQVKEADSNAQL